MVPEPEPDGLDPEQRQHAHDCAGNNPEVTVLVGLSESNKNDYCSVQCDPAGDYKKAVGQPASDTETAVAVTKDRVTTVNFEISAPKAGFETREAEEEQPGLAELYNASMRLERTCEKKEEALEESVELRLQLDGLIERIAMLMTEESEARAQSAKCKLDNHGTSDEYGAKT